MASDPDADLKINLLRYDLQVTHKLLTDMNVAFVKRVLDLEEEVRAAHAILKDLSTTIGSRVGVLDKVVADNSKILAGQSASLARILEILEGDH